MATVATIPVSAEIGDILLATFDDRYNRHAPIYPRYTNVMPGERTPETVQPFMYFGELVATALGGATTYQDLAEAYKSTVAVDAAKRALGFVAEELSTKLDRSGRMRRAADQLAKSAQHTKETVAAGVLNNGFATNHATRAVPLFSNSNPLFGGGTYDNLISGDLSIATFESAMIQFANFVDDRGLKINVMPKYLAHTPNDRRVAKQIVGSDKEPFHAENQTNVYKGIVEAVENPWFTDADNAFLLAGAEENGLVMVVWQDTKRRAWLDEDTDSLKFKAWLACAVIPGGADFRGAVGIQGA